MAPVSSSRVRPTLKLRLPLVLVAAQIYDPTLLIGEFKGPLELTEAGRPPSYRVNWSLGQVQRARTSVAGGAGLAWCSTLQPSAIFV